MSRDFLSQLEVAALRPLFVAFATYGLVTLAGERGLGSGTGRIVATVFLILSVLAVVMLAVEYDRHGLE